MGRGGGRVGEGGVGRKGGREAGSVAWHCGSSCHLSAFAQWCLLATLQGSEQQGRQQYL